MARRSRRPRHYAPNQKLALSVSNTTAAAVKLDQLRHNMVRAMVDFEGITASFLIENMFDDATRKIVHDAYGVVAGGSPMTSYLVATNVQLSFRVWDSLRMMAPENSQMRLNIMAMTPFLDKLTTVQDILKQFAVAQYVLNWLNVNATESALRYYWPAICTLIPEAGLDALPTRYNEPNGLGEILPLIRASADTIANAQFAPEGKPWYSGSREVDVYFLEHSFGGEFAGEDKRIQTSGYNIYF